MDLTFQDFKTKSKISAKYNKPNQFNEEGEDHLNISAQSKTRLGRFLDPGYCFNFEYPHVGEFKSALALGYWLRSKDLDDKIRKLAGQKLKRYVAEHNLYNKRIPNYTAIIANAVWLRVKSRPEVLRSIKELDPTLTILSYYTHKTSNIRITTNYAPMVVAIATEIIAAVKEDREPNILQFATHKTLTGMDYLEAVLNKKIKKTQTSGE